MCSSYFLIRLKKYWSWLQITCFEILSEQLKKGYYIPKVFFLGNIYKNPPCRSFIETRRLFTITYVLEILISGFRPHSRKIFEDVTQLDYNIWPLSFKSVKSIVQTAEGLTRSQPSPIDRGCDFILAYPR